MALVRGRLSPGRITARELLDGLDGSDEAGLESGPVGVVIDRARLFDR